MTPLLRCDPRMGATTVSSMDGHIWRWAGNIPPGFEPEFEPRLAHYSKCYTYTWFLLGFAKHIHIQFGTFETNGKCPMADIPVANLAITAKAGVGGALILQNAVSNKYNRVINREGLNSLQALMRRPFNGTPVAVTKTTTMKTILGWVQSGVFVPWIGLLWSTWS